jgi:hypothetical protein
LSFLGGAQVPGTDDIVLVGNMPATRKDEMTHVGLLYFLGHDLKPFSFGTLDVWHEWTGVEVIHGDGESWNVAGWTLGEPDRSFWGTVGPFARDDVARR